MLYQVGDSRHTQNIQINKVICENEKRVLYFTGKTLRTFGTTQYSESCLWSAAHSQPQVYLIYGAFSKKKFEGGMVQSFQNKPNFVFILTLSLKFGQKAEYL